MIQGVTVRQFSDMTNDEGSIQHFLRSDDPEFERFGEVYFSTTNKGVTKGWHVHEEQTSILSCIWGEVLLVLYDVREDSETKGEFQEVTFGDGKRAVVKIPPGIAYGWKALTTSTLANVTSNPHGTTASKKISVPYEW